MSFLKITSLINKSSDFVELLPVYLFLKNKNRIAAYPFLFCELLIHGILDISTFILTLLSIYNLFIYHAIGLFELIFIFLFYKRLTELPKYIFYCFYLVLILYILNSLFLEPIFNPAIINAFGRSLSCLFLLFLGFIYLYNLYKKDKIINFYQNPDFLINSGLMIYFATSFFTFLFSKKILSLELSSFFSAAWVLHSSVDIIRAVMISIGLQKYTNK
ncbi:MAG: hypothetical protein ACNS60_03710 [Candidatus Cyclobacteriaceae bacterium M2_1C_046]